MTTNWFNFWSNTEYNEIKKIQSIFETEEIDVISRAILYQINARKNNTILCFGNNNDINNFVKKGIRKLSVVEYRRKAIENINRNIEFIFADVFETKIKNGSFDGCYCHSLFNFLDINEAIATMSEMKNVTKTGGLILISDVIKENQQVYFDSFMRNLGAPKMECIKEQVMKKLLDNLDVQNYVIYDTVIPLYKNNRRTYNVLIKK